MTNFEVVFFRFFVFPNLWIKLVKLKVLATIRNYKRENWKKGILQYSLLFLIMCSIYLCTYFHKILDWLINIFAFVPSWSLKSQPWIISELSIFYNWSGKYCNKKIFIDKLLIYSIFIINQIKFLIFGRKKLYPWRKLNWTQETHWRSAL